MTIFNLLILLFASHALATPIENISDVDPGLQKLFSKRSIEYNSDITSYHNVVSGDDEACVDYYSATCNEKISKVLREYNFQENLKKKYYSIKDEFTHILSTEYNANDDLDLEREFYRNCMSLGEEKEDKEKLTISSEKMITMDLLFKTTLENFGYKVEEDNWQAFDQKLASLGLEHTFFDISIEKDFERPDTNIIVVRPPSIREWNRKINTLPFEVFLQLQINASKRCKKQYPISAEENQENDYWTNEKTLDNASRKLTHSIITADIEDEDKKTEDINEICKLIPGFNLDTDIHVSRNRDVSYLFDDFVGSVFSGINFNAEKEFTKRLTLQEFNDFYQTETAGRETAKINWLQVIQSTFKPLNIKIEDDEPIYVVNAPYFRKLAKYLGDRTDEQIAQAVKTKFVVRNIRYSDWKWANSMSYTDKKSFCLEDTKYYSSSAIILDKVLLNLTRYQAKVKSVLKNTFNAFWKNITEDKELLTSKRINLVSELNTLRKYPLASHGKNYDLRIYKDFKLTGKYIVDTNNLRQLLKNKLLSQLRTEYNPTFEPFSITDMNNIRNRLTTYVVLSADVSRNIFLDYPFNSEVHYATFGVNLARYIHSLLTEESYENDVRNRQDFDWFVPRNPITGELTCFTTKELLNFSYPKVQASFRELFGVYFAHQALLNFNKNSSKQDFFKIYVNTLCNGVYDKKLIQKMLLNLNEFTSAFKCQTKHKLCRVAAFS